MRRIAVFFFLLIVAAARAFAADCRQYPVGPYPNLQFFAPQPGTDQPALILLTHVTPGEYEAPVATIHGDVIDVVQLPKKVPADQENCNVAVAAVILPPFVGKAHYTYNWYYDARGIASREAELSIEPDLFTVVPAHPDATTPVSLVANGPVRITLSEPAIPNRSGSKFDVRETCGPSPFENPALPRTRTAMLGLLSPGEYEGSWVIQYPDLNPNSFRQHHLRFTVDPGPRRRTNGGGSAPSRALAGPCPTLYGSVSLVPPGFGDPHASLWIEQSAGGTKANFGVPVLKFDGTSFRVTQDATVSPAGAGCYYARIDIPDSLHAGVQYPLEWNTNFVRTDGGVEVHKQLYTLEYDSFAATMEVQPLAPGRPMIAFIEVPGSQPSITNSYSQPWTRIDGQTIFIDVTTFETYTTHTLAAIPPLAPGTYDVVITAHHLLGSVHRTHVPLVIPQAALAGK